MSADRELLELAAKAAGYDVLFWADKCAFKAAPYKPWNPRDDDGDSFRLAVTLNLGVQSQKAESNTLKPATVILFDLPQGTPTRLTQAHDGDAMAATRLAILRAGAVIGRAMP